MCCHAFLDFAPTTILGTIFFATTLTVAIVMPYRKVYMNYLDILLLSNLTVFSCMLSSGHDKYALLMRKILLATPIIVLVPRKNCDVITRIHTWYTYLKELCSEMCERFENYKSPSDHWTNPGILSWYSIKRTATDLSNSHYHRLWYMYQWFRVKWHKHAY